MFCTVLVNKKRQKYLDVEELKKVKNAGVPKSTSDRVSEPEDSASVADGEPLSLLYCDVRYTHADASTTALPLVGDCANTGK